MIFTPRQLMFAKQVSEGMTYGEIARFHALSVHTAKLYTEEIADRIRGNLPARAKVAVWYRVKCGLSVLTGEPLTPLSTRHSVMQP